MARHAQWVSSSALGTLLPRLQQNARELLSDLAAKRALVGNAPAATPRMPSSGGKRCHSVCPHVVVSRLESALDKCTCCLVGGGDLEGSKEPSGAAVAAAASASTSSSAPPAFVADDKVEALRSLTRECETLRIVVQALREKDEETQVTLCCFAQ